MNPNCLYAGPGDSRWVVAVQGEAANHHTNSASVKPYSTYPHKPPEEDEIAICHHQADSPPYVWPVVCSGDLLAEKRVWSSRQGHTWHLMSLLRTGVMKEQQLKLLTYFAGLNYGFLYSCIFSIWWTRTGVGLLAVKGQMAKNSNGLQPSNFKRLLL